MTFLSLHCTEWNFIGFCSVVSFVLLPSEASDKSHFVGALHGGYQSHGRNIVLVHKRCGFSNTFALSNRETKHADAL